MLVLSGHLELVQRHEDREWVHSAAVGWVLLSGELSTWLSMGLSLGTLPCFSATPKCRAMWACPACTSPRHVL